MKNMKIINGNCIAVMRDMPDCSVDAIVTDPPYELGFMGKSWDKSGIAFSTEMWSECFRVLKHGGHLLSFAAPRTYHRIAVAIEDAGFEMRDMIMWLFGSGFPKSHDIGKAVDKICGNERVKIGVNKGHTGDRVSSHSGVHDDDNYKWKGEYDVSVGYSEWEGWGSALKPAHEPIVMARKPLARGMTIAHNVLAYGVGGINISACRIPSEPVVNNRLEKFSNFGQEVRPAYTAGVNNAGRFPSNVITDGSDEVTNLLPNSKGSGGSVPKAKTTGYGENIGNGKAVYLGGERLEHDCGEGSVARFYYCAKASKSDREQGLEDFIRHNAIHGKDGDSRGLTVSHSKSARANNHPTVKPTELMRYLCRLITPPNGVVLDPFMGSGSTGKGAILEGFDFIGIELDSAYCDIAVARINAACAEKDNTLF